MARQCFISPEELLQDHLVIRGTEAHHLNEVMRAQPADTVELFDGAGRTATAEIDSQSRRQIALRVVSRGEVPPPAVRLVLIQALPRTAAMEFIVQKATELGAMEIIPVCTRNSVARVKPGDAGRKAERWKTIAVNAAKQCGNAWLPQIHPPVSWEQCTTGFANFDLLLVGDLHGEAAPLQDIVKTFQPQPGARIGCIIGPEGDLTLEELERAGAAGARRIDLGPLVLRVDTAALYVLSVLASAWLHAGPDVPNL